MMRASPCLSSMIYVCRPEPAHHVTVSVGEIGHRLQEKTIESRRTWSTLPTSLLAACVFEQIERTYPKTALSAS